METRTYAVPEEVLIGLLNYLRQRPYSEVVQAVPALEAIVQAGPLQASKEA